MNRRQSRTERRRGVRVVLGQRDEALLRAVARFRAVRTQDLLPIFFSGVSRERCAQRLRRLFDAGFLDVRFGRLSEPNVYGLGEAGRRWAREHGFDVNPMPSGDLSHHLALVGLWSRLAVRLNCDPGMHLTSFRPDWELRRSCGALPVIPDALIELDAGGGSRRSRLALEVDLGSESEATWRHKLTGYTALLADSAALLGWEEFGLAVVVVGAGPRRHRTVSDLVTECWPAKYLVIRSEEWPDGLLRSLGTPALPAGSSGSRKSPLESRPTPLQTSLLEEEGP